MIAGRDALKCSGARAECWVAWLCSLRFDDAIKATTKTDRPRRLLWGGFSHFSDHESCKGVDSGHIFRFEQCWHVPFRPACFSPCAPKPKPLDLSSRSEASAGFPPKREGRNLGVPRSPLCMGRVPPALQARMLRSDFASSRKMRPRVMFKQPTEKRKNAATSVNLSTWWERIVAPMLKGRSAFELNSLQEGRTKHLQCLENPEGAETKLRTEDREKAVEKGYRPGDLG